MREFPILFSPDMVRLILAGRKSQTTRLTEPNWKPGDLLWVRENWYADKKYDDVAPRNLHPDRTRYGFIADGEKPEWAGRTRVSIHLPYWMSRITLVVEKVNKAQGIQSITEEEACHEGFSWWDDIIKDYANKPYPAYCWFKDLWIKLNGEDAWSNNPKTWATLFNVESIKKDFNWTT